MQWYTMACHTTACPNALTITLTTKYNTTIGKVLQSVDLSIELILVMSLTPSDPGRERTCMITTVHSTGLSVGDTNGLLTGVDKKGNIRAEYMNHVLHQPSVTDISMFQKHNELDSLLNSLACGNFNKKSQKTVLRGRPSLQTPLGMNIRTSARSVTAGNSPTGILLAFGIQLGIQKRHQVRHNSY